MKPRVLVLRTTTLIAGISSLMTLLAEVVRGNDCLVNNGRLFGGRSNDALAGGCGFDLRNGGARVGCGERREPHRSRKVLGERR